LVTHRAAAELLATAQSVAPPTALTARMMARIAAEKHATAAVAAAVTASRAETARQTPTSRGYMLWMIRDGKPVPLKLYTPGDDGQAIVAAVELPTKGATR